MSKKLNKNHFYPLTKIPLGSRLSAISTLLFGNLHRYNKTPHSIQPTRTAEQILSTFFGGTYTHLVHSGGTGLQIALRAMGINYGDIIATNSYTLSPVSGAIASVGAKPAYIETTTTLTPCVEHLTTILEREKVKLVLLSHMRGRIPNLTEITKICAHYSVPMIEDCAHALGSYHNGRLVGTFGSIGVFSLQENKPINAGEGGFLVTKRYKLYETIAELSGSYAFPSTFSKNSKIEKRSANYPNLSARIDEVRASLIPKQVKLLSARRKKSQELYNTFIKELIKGEYFKEVPYPDTSDTIRLSVQFKKHHNYFTAASQIERTFVKNRLPITWINRPQPLGYHSQPVDWLFLEPISPQNSGTINQLRDIVADIFDMPLPLHFNKKQIKKVAKLINKTQETMQWRLT